IRDRVGHLRVSEIARSDIAKLHHDLRFAPVQANRCLQFLSKAFNLAEVWGLRPDGTNPCRHVKKYPEKCLAPLSLSHADIISLSRGEGFDDTEAVF
ncbi:MAG: site-specific integrase, partial [Rhodospirillaceae bacterium]|nr:site-specific integrase [Rhodospirillaceae bacterium]